MLKLNIYITIKTEDYEALQEALQFILDCKRELSIYYDDALQNICLISSWKPSFIGICDAVCLRALASLKSERFFY